MAKKAKKLETKQGRNNIPKKIPVGKVLCHNNVKHDKDTRSGVHGFRAWFEKAPPKGFKPCKCGWSGLPHYGPVTTSGLKSLQG